MFFVKALKSLSGVYERGNTLLVLHVDSSSSDECVLFFVATKDNSSTWVASDECKFAGVLGMIFRESSSRKPGRYFMEAENI